MPRKKPFSSKQKKFQLQDKRKRKQVNEEHENVIDDVVEIDGDGASVSTFEPVAGTSGQLDQLNKQPNKNRQFNQNRYGLHFFKDSNEEVQKRKEFAYKSIYPCSDEDLEVDADIVYRTGTSLDLPKRQPWDYKLTKKVLEAREERYFKQYVDAIFKEYPPDQLSYFELNLETWRQLWRVLEMSDILLLIIDIRYPSLHFSPALYYHVTEELGKQIIVVFNKIDLVPSEVVIAWKHFMTERYPKVNIVFFTSYPQYFVEDGQTTEEGAKKRRKHKGSRWKLSSGAADLLAVCQTIVKDKVDLSSWHHKIHQDTQEYDNSTDEETDDEDVKTETRDLHDHKQEAFKDGVLTVGCVGYPNVGKSSLLNGLVRKKVVSVSKTPGHTKHFQTIFLTPTVKLCDCPGLVFPSLVEKPLQILAGIYPIAQVREPYTPIGYFSCRVDVISQLKLKHPSGSPEDSVRFDEGGWSSMDICEAWAEKRGFLTAKAGRLDVYRAANNLLRMALDGRICLSLKPPGFTKQRDMWKAHNETKALKDKLSQFKKSENNSDDEGAEESEDEKDENEADSDSDEENVKEKGFVSKNPFDLLTEDD